jgi:hypothetical protein
MSIGQAITWDVARAGGFTAFGLLTLSVALGLALTLHLQSPRWPRIINSELHNHLTLLALIFTGVHILAVWIDPFTSFGWNEIFIPFASHYRPLWMALGIVAFYIGLAIGISTWLRPHIGYLWWRRLHVLTLLLYALVVVHGIATGSDTRTWWGAALYATSVLLVGILLYVRLMKPVTARSRAHPLLGAAAVAAIAVGTGWALLGPFQPGWNAIANNGKGSGSAPTSTVRAAPSQHAVFPASFTSNLQGQLTRTGPDANGTVIMQFDLRMSNGPSGYVQVILRGQSARDEEGEREGEGGGITITASRVVLASSSGQPLYVGSLTTISGRRQWFMMALLTRTSTNSRSQLRVQMTIQINASGQASGTITAASPNAAGSGV